MNTIELPKIASRDEWLRARKVLLAKEKEITRARDAVNAERRRLPMVEIDKDYVFEGPAGKASLCELFDGRRQLFVYHFMFAPDWENGCPSCTHLADEVPRVISGTCGRVTSVSPASPARRWPNWRRTKRAMAGRFRGTPRMAAISTTISMSPWTNRSRLSGTTIGRRPSTSRRAQRTIWAASNP